MIVIAAAAIYGAWLGFSMKPGPRAVIYAIGSVAAIQYIAMASSPVLVRQPGLEGLAWTIQAYAGTRALDLAPTTSAAGFAAALTAILAAVTQSDEQRRRMRRISAIKE